MPIKVKLRDPAHPKDEKGEDGGAGSQVAGQALSSEQLSQLSEQIGATIAGVLGQAQKDNPAPKQSQPVHQLLGMKESELSRIKNKLGEEESDVLLGVLQNVVTKSQANDSMIVEAIKEMSAGFAEQMREQQSALQQISSRPRDTTDLWNIYGFDIFENNKEDLKEALELATQQSGGLTDYVESFENAQESDDFQYLKRVKDVILEPYLEGKYKDHSDVGGDTGRVAGRANLKKEEERQKEYDNLQGQYDSFVRDKNHIEALKVLQQQKALLNQEEVGNSQI